MIIYGVAILAFCFLVGKLVGGWLASLIGLSGDVGGVGFAMVFLMLINLYLKRRGWLKLKTSEGVFFWSAMYLPVIIAMAATQDVKAAMSGGPIAVVVGAVVTITGFYLVPVIAKIGKKRKLDL